jgi:hypothetical protein
MRTFSLGGILAIGLMLMSARHALALTVSPAKMELYGDPGSTIYGEFQLTNEQNEPKTLYSSTEKFEAQGETGTPAFSPATEGIATWITVPESITLKPKEQATITFSVKIPEKADAGGQFGSIFWSPTPQGEKEVSQLSIGTKIGMLVLLKVSGETAEGGSFLGFNTKNNQKAYSALPVSFTYRLQDTGNDRLQPKGMITVKNTFGGTAVKLDANPMEGNVLPDSIRKFEINWNVSGDAAATEQVAKGFWQKAGAEWKNFKIGRYTAKLDLSYGKDNTEVHRVAHFWIIPWHLLLIVFVVVGGGIAAAGMSLKMHDKMLLKNARNKR